MEFFRQRRTNDKNLNMLINLARQETEASNRRAWNDNKQFNWQYWPLPERYLKALVRVSLSHDGGCKGGAVSRRGVPDANMAGAFSVLWEAGFVIDDGYVPTELGWKMLEHFARAESRFPEGYKFEDGTVNINESKFNQKVMMYSKQRLRLP